MNIDRRRLLRLLPLTGLSAVSGCSESDEEKVARVERAIEAHKQGPVVIDAEKDKATKAVEPLEDIGKKMVLFAAADLRDPFQSLQSALLEVAVRKSEGCAYKVVDAAGSAEKQLKQLAEIRTKHPNCLVLSAVDAALVGKVAEEMRREGTFVVGVDERLQADSCNSLVFVVQKKMGQMAAQQILEALKRKAADEGRTQITGRVVHLTGSTESFTSRSRSDGLREGLKVEPGVVLVHEAAGNWSREGGKLRTEDALRLQHEFDVVCAQNDYMAQGASDALSAAQRRERVLIVGMDGGLELVRKSIIDISILQPMPLQTAYERIAKSMNDSHFMPPVRTELLPRALTPANIDDFVAETLRALKQ